MEEKVSKAFPHHKKDMNDIIKERGRTMYIEEAYYFWRLASDLLLNHDFDVLQINEEKNEILLEKTVKRKAYVVRIKQETFDWANHLKQDQDQLIERLKQFNRQLLGKEIEVQNVYIAEFPPVDEWSERQEPIQLKGRKHSTIYHHYIIGERTEKIDEVYRSMGLKEPTFAVPSEFEMERAVVEMKRSMKRRYQNNQQKMQQIFSAGKPRITYIMLFLNLVLFAWLEYQGGSTNTLTLVQYGAKYNPAIVDGEWWRIVSSMFLHIGFIHIMLNMLALYYLGSPVERMYGSVRFTFIYFVSGIVGGVTSFALTPSVAAGASGAIYGLFGALLFFGVVHKKLFFQTMGSNLLWIIALNIVFSFSIPQVDMGAHLGGLFGGFLASAIVHFPRHRNIAMQIGALVVVISFCIGMAQYGVVNEDNHYDARLQARLAQGYAEKGDTVKAIRLVNVTFQHTDKTADLYFSRAFAYSKKGSGEQAFQDLQKAISIRPSFALAHHNLSIIYQHRGETEEAVKHAEKAVQLNPDDERFQDQLQSLEKSG